MLFIDGIVAIELLIFQMRGTYFNTYKMSYEICVLGWWGELKMWRRDFKEVRFVIMLLDENNI